MLSGRHTGIISGRLDLQQNEELRYSKEPEVARGNYSVAFSVVEYEVDDAVCPTYYSYRLAILVVWL